MKQKPQLVHPYYFSWKKRAFDVFGASILLFLLFPLLLLLGLIVLITVGQPILFFQSRIGKNGTLFTLFKFRTMKKNAERIKHLYKHKNDAPEPMFKIHNDPRFVGLGRFLSRSGLDELPQLINILKGEMSFVGPRPLPVKEARALPLAWRRMREQVKPGILSEWTLDEDRHSNLKYWKKLEKETLKKGSLKKDLIYCIVIPLSQMRLMFRKKSQV